MNTHASTAPRFANIRAVLFDLDGTLIDSAPDLAAAANAMRRTRGLSEWPLAHLRPWTSHGARGLLGAAFDMKPQDPAWPAMRDEFLATYERQLCVATGLFDGMAEVLAALEAKGLAWGIVTNKIARFTDPIVAALGLAGRAGAVVSGDTTAHPKPHPGPLLHAAQAMGIAPEFCVYVGDDLRDIQAGRAAAMGTIAAAWGYCADSAPSSWQADAVIDHPHELPGMLG